MEEFPSTFNKETYNQTNASFGTKQTALLAEVRKTIFDNTKEALEKGQSDCEFTISDSLNPKTKRQLAIELFERFSGKIYYLRTSGSFWAYMTEPTVAPTYKIIF